jgi:branched-chain amino acid aminotransferase
MSGDQAEKETEMSLASLASDPDVHPAWIWRNDEIIPWEQATVHVNSVGHASVSSVFEGIKAYYNPDHAELYVFRLEEHIRRFLESARIVRLDLNFDAHQLVAGIMNLLRKNKAREDIYVRPWCFVSGLVREQIAPGGASTDMIIDTWPFSTAMLQERVCSTCVSSWRRIDDTSMPPRAKVFSNYHNSRLACIEATQGGYDWPIFLNDRGKVTEGPGACVAMIRQGELVTPNIASGVLESITRATLMELAGDVLGLPVVEREIDRTELYVCDELFYMGTGWEILPIGRIDGLAVGDGQMGAIAKQLDHLYHDIVRGIDARYEHWRAAVPV